MVCLSFDELRFDVCVCVTERESETEKCFFVWYVGLGGFKDMYVCMYMCVCVYIYIYIHTQLHTCIHAYMHTYIHTMHTCMNTIHIHNPHIYNTYTHTHMHAYAYVHAYRCDAQFGS